MDQEALETAFSISTGNQKCCFSDVFIRVHRLSQAFTIAGYWGRWQAKSAVTDDEPGLKRPRNSVFDCNWQSKMQFLRCIEFVDCHEHVLIAGYPGRRQSKTTVTDDERGSINFRNSATENAVCKTY